MSSYAVVTGGGTAGHVLPALAVAEALVAAGHERSTVHFVGTARGVESRLLPPTGFPHTLLDISGLPRGLRPRDLWNTARLPWRAWRALRAARRLLRARPKGQGGGCSSCDSCAGCPVGGLKSPVRRPQSR